MNELRDVFTKYKAVVFFDTETTGLEAESCQIIELAAIRVEKTERGTLRMADSADVFVKLPEGERIPQKIVELTGITDEQLKNEGITEAEAAARFTELISGGRVLLVATLRRHGNGGPEALRAADYLDSLTVYKDRRAYPHKLANAILAYKLEDKVQNSHRAIDDVAALFEVCKAMDAERSDLLSYVNVFGYNPKYGVSGKRIEKVAYWPQNFNKYMQAPSYTLPAKLRQRRR
jgi:DNA polymerase-3 subunit epsilon